VTGGVQACVGDRAVPGDRFHAGGPEAGYSDVGARVGSPSGP
jgi:hypothetical protein